MQPGEPAREGNADGSSAGTGAHVLPLMPAHLLGLGAFQLAGLLALVDLQLAALPLALFVGVCLAAPFVPSWRLFGPILTRGRRDPAAVALTFDDGPDPSTTPALLELLARHGAPATFFVVGSRAACHPELVRRILAAGHGIGNHSQTHDPLLMLRSRARLRQELLACQQQLARCGVRTLAFRPPAGIVNPRLWPVLLELGLLNIGFSRRGLDFGNRRLRGLAARLLRGVRPGDVLLLHDGPVRDPAGVAGWLTEVGRLLQGLDARGLAVRPLAELVGRPLAEPVQGAAPAGSSADPVQGAAPAGSSADPVRAFYDGLAPDYDAEQERAPLRRTETAAVLARLERLLRPGARVLEVGAGTGRFTLELAARGGAVTAVELSPAMAARLAAKTRGAGHDGVRVRCGNARQLDLGGPYELVCCFSVLEYLRDPAPLLRRLAATLAPGGSLLLTTAHRGLPRWFVQLGNAMRQGLWLEAHSRAGMRRLLAGSGLEPVELSTHGLRCPPWSGGMLLLVEARPRTEPQRGAGQAAPG